MSRHKLIHFGNDYITAARSEKQGTRSGGAYKPNGLWVSVEGGKSFGWRAWCEGENFGKIDAALQTEIALRPDAEIIWIKTARALDAFTDRYFYPDSQAHWRHYAHEPDWHKVANDYQGIIIAPYLWSRRHHDISRWYYSWDCASGCIWDAAAVADLRPLPTEEPNA